ncbi:MAG: hypothetical protein WDN66_02385 [Candidatus Saccharibacteria bacterium]
MKIADAESIAILRALQDYYSTHIQPLKSTSTYTYNHIFFPNLYIFIDSQAALQRLQHPEYTTTQQSRKLAARITAKKANITLQ